MNHLHTCLRFTTCISARSQRLRIAKRNEKNGSICSSLSSPWGQIDRFNRALFLLVWGNPVLEPLKCKCNSLFAIFLCNLLGMLCRSFFFTQGLRTNLKCISCVILGLDCWSDWRNEGFYTQPSHIRTEKIKSVTVYMINVKKKNLICGRSLNPKCHRNLKP